ncbi:MAG: hypothetical protein P4L10_14635 [Acidobacteriaceae bacterium]|nr:hypothetical protein [Acidobacteriaceae bacterium]
MKKRTLSFMAALMLLGVSILHAQSAPIPAQLITAKTVFLSNAGTGSNADNKYSTLGYNDFYSQLTAWNHYQLVLLPANSDLIMELTSNPGLLTLSIRDPKSSTILWTLSEQVKFWHSEKGIEKNMGAAAAKLVDDLKTLLKRNN